MARRLAPCVNRRDVRDLYLVVSAIPHTRFAGEPKEFYVRTEDELSIAEKVAKLPQVEIDPLFSGYTHNDYASLDFDWNFWGRPEQLAPPALAQKPIGSQGPCIRKQSNLPATTLDGALVLCAPRDGSH